MQRSRNLLKSKNTKITKTTKQLQPTSKITITRIITSITTTVLNILKIPLIRENHFPLLVNKIMQGFNSNSNSKIQLRDLITFLKVITNNLSNLNSFKTIRSLQ